MSGPSHRAGKKRAEHNADEYIERMKSERCKQCPLSLRCLSGKLYEAELYLCQKCQGWWLVEDSIVVRCDGFPNTVELIEGAERVTTRMPSPISSYEFFQRAPHLFHGKPIDVCPACRSKGETFKVIDGYRVRTEP